MSKIFKLDGKGPKTLGEIARDVVLNYAEKHPKMTAQQVRDTFVTACAGVKMPAHVVETETEYHLRNGQKSQKRTVKEITIPNGEKLYVSTQWHAKKPGHDFFNFRDIVHKNGWGKIV